MEKYTDIKTFDDACQIEGYDPKVIIPDFSAYPEKHRKAAIAEAKLFIVVEAVNKVANGGKEYIPDWDNGKWDKYEPLFYMSPSGFRYYDCDRWNAFSNVGSRLCSISSEVCEYIATQFIDLYKDIYVK